VTYGYNPLPLARYLNYYSAAQKNPRLIAGLNAGLSINAQTGALEPNPAALPRFSIPRTVSSASGAGSLAQLDPAAGSVVEGSLDGIKQDPTARVETLFESVSEYRLRYRTSTPTLLRAAIPSFPGWKANGPGGELPVRIVDHAFVGIVMPQGEGNILLRFRPPYFMLGALISVATLITAVVLASMGLARKAPAASEQDGDTAGGLISA
jgi:hypothetical protein